MAIIPNSIINATKSLADTYGIINEGTRYLLDIFNPQNKNLFEILLVPEPLPKNAVTIDTTLMTTQEYAARSFLDNVVTKLHVQSIDIPFLNLEYARYDYLQGVFDITYADEVTITFIENELGVVRNFLNNWLKLTVKDNPAGGVVFVDNQWLGRKKAIVIPQMTTGAPSAAWVELRGLRYKLMENWTLAQNESDPMYITVTFACDKCWIISPL